VTWGLVPSTTLCQVTVIHKLSSNQNLFDLSDCNADVDTTALLVYHGFTPTSTAVTIFVKYYPL
jgi:hypothetical protein